MIESTVVSYLEKNIDPTVNPEANYDDIFNRGQFNEAGMHLDTNLGGTPDTNLNDILHRGKCLDTNIRILAMDAILW